MCWQDSNQFDNAQELELCLRHEGTWLELLFRKNVVCRLKW